jgi:hypothetical protein
VVTFLKSENTFDIFMAVFLHHRTPVVKDTAFLESRILKILRPDKTKPPGAFHRRLVHPLKLSQIIHLCSATDGPKAASRARIGAIGDDYPLPAIFQTGRRWQCCFCCTGIPQSDSWPFIRASR